MVTKHAQVGDGEQGTCMSESTCKQMPIYCVYFLLLRKDL